MAYLIFILVIAAIVWLSSGNKGKYKRLKKEGTKVTGLIITNKEDGSNDNYRLGGNINNPTVRFYTEEGREIIGTPVIGFVSQFEVVPPMKVVVYYDPIQPDKFCVDFE